MNKTILKRVLPVVAGALLGFAYYYYIGCYNGSCAISSNPYISTVYGGLIGFLISFPSKRKKKKEESVEEDN
jgi:hypothetical protein